MRTAREPARGTGPLPRRRPSATGMAGNDGHMQSIRGRASRGSGFSCVGSGAAAGSGRTSGPAASPRPGAPRGTGCVCASGTGPARRSNCGPGPRPRPRPRPNCGPCRRPNCGPGPCPNCGLCRRPTCGPGSCPNCGPCRRPNCGPGSHPPYGPCCGPPLRSGCAVSRTASPDPGPHCAPRCGAPLPVRRWRLWGARSPCAGSWAIGPQLQFWGRMAVRARFRVRDCRAFGAGSRTRPPSPSASPWCCWCPQAPWGRSQGRH